MNKNIYLKVGENHTIDELLLQLVDSGYSRIDKLELPGQFSVIGGTVLIFTTAESNPHRIEFFGNSIDEISEFEIETGKSLTKKSEINIPQNVLSLADHSKARPGDYVVHEDHGIGYFDCFQTKVVEGKKQLYIVLRYLNNDS